MFHAGGTPPTGAGAVSPSQKRGVACRPAPAVGGLFTIATGVGSIFFLNVTLGQLSLDPSVCAQNYVVVGVTMLWPAYACCGRRA